MGSVIDYIECPNCKTEAFSDFYYKTGEEYVNCQNCGYHRSTTIINRDKPFNELTNEDWDIKEVLKPYGAYRLKTYLNTAHQCGSLESEEQYNELKYDVTRDPEIEHCSVSRFVDGEIKVEVLVDNEPEVDSAGFTINER